MEISKLKLKFNLWLYSLLLIGQSLDQEGLFVRVFTIPYHVRNKIQKCSLLIPQFYHIIN